MLDYYITVDGIKIPREDIISLTISKNAGNLPIDGIAKSELSVTFAYDGDFGASAAAPVRIYIDNAPKYQKFYIYTRKIRNGVITLSCIDKMMVVSQPFDYTTVTVDSDGRVLVSDILLQIGRQCGFTSVGAYPEVIDTMDYQDLVDASCDDILTMLSQIFCGVWYTDTENDMETLRFNTFGEITEMVLLDDTVHSDIVTGAVKGPIARIVASNSKDTIDTGGTTDFEKTLKLSGKLFTEQVASSLLGIIRGATYTAFAIDQTAAVTDAHICCGVVVGAVTYTACKITVTISVGGIITGFSAADLCEPEWDYTGALTRKLKNKIDYNTPSAGTYFTRKDGIKIEGDYAVITAANGKMTIFKKPKKSVDEEDNASG